MLPNQAATFNSCCWSRAALPCHPVTPFLDRGDIDKALDLRMPMFEPLVPLPRLPLAEPPFIIAGHSRGGLHADWLMRDYVASGPLEERMVAAYPIGFSIDGSNGVPVCEHAEQTGYRYRGTWRKALSDADRIRAMISA